MIGLSVLMAARAVQPDCEVTVLSRYEFQSQMAERLGAKNILYERDGYRGIAKASGGKFFSAPLNKGIVVGGFDLIYDCVGNARTLNDCLRWVKAKGKVVLVGSTSAHDPADLFHLVSTGGTGRCCPRYRTLAGEEKHTNGS
jgi:threonine dehydrogenase-like Zn-dependent dehydrogenase